MVSNIFKGVHDLQLSWGNSGVFVRGNYWYDFELKDGSRKLYDIDDSGRLTAAAERRFYVDEDTWQIAIQDMFDGRGTLWRVGEGHTVQFFEQQIPMYAGETLYDLQNRRYLAMGFSNEESRGPVFGEKTSLNDYSPGSLRLEGVR